MRGRGLSRAAAVLGTGGLLAVSALTGCSEEPSTSAGPVSTVPGVGQVTEASDGVQEITLQTQDDYVFTPDSFTVEPGRVRLTVVNAARDMTHNFRFTPGEGPEPIAAEISLLAPGQEKTIEFEVRVPGDHEFVCTFHTQLNQVGTMTVSG
jgi:plastocyanin